MKLDKTASSLLLSLLLVLLSPITVRAQGCDQTCDIENYNPGNCWECRDWGGLGNPGCDIRNCHQCLS